MAVLQAVLSARQDPAAQHTAEVHHLRNVVATPINGLTIITVAAARIPAHPEAAAHTPARQEAAARIPAHPEVVQLQEVPLTLRRAEAALHRQVHLAEALLHRPEVQADHTVAAAVAAEAAAAAAEDNPNHI